ncbi:hypothetical protein [Chitinophaga sancti]|uniref:Beta-propeller repeat-containing protein n=1 Tax=Chitinophaga sancti TaxID=1004 RepID=A0A1K1LWQ3_9BACT|nr:hypothetical protein [Chitinophaga sancti]WQD64779.1 hypothetical protein U0033_10270 [Chitinophaga sancti]WQG89597.1 hypothetical protein SR876_32200 [Chitinophaga sancti]SFW15357.1 hypothetical protein SAMN05661012_00286 [Chitinophaga sancti]
MRTNILATFIATIFLMSCSKDNNETIDNDPKKTTVYALTGAADASGNYTSKVWKDNTSTSYDASLRDIAVDGNDIYAISSGYIQASKRNYILLWKNGKADTLATSSGQLQAIAINVSNKNVYVAGYESAGKIVSKIWKNGVATPLSSDATFGTTVNDMEVVGDDVYVIGEAMYANNGSVPNVGMIWKNGQPTKLTDAKYYVGLSKVFVSGSDVYVGGIEYNSAQVAVAKIWKNGTPTILSDGKNQTYVYGLFVDGKDVYATLEENIGAIKTGKIWKNGVTTEFKDGSNPAVPFEIFLKDSVVYTLGQVSKDIKLWKNNEGTQLTKDAQWSQPGTLIIK